MSQINYTDAHCENVCISDSAKYIHILSAATDIALIPCIFIALCCSVIENIVGCLLQSWQQICGSHCSMTSLYIIDLVRELYYPITCNTPEDVLPIAKIGIVANARFLSSSD